MLFLAVGIAGIFGWVEGLFPFKAAVER